MERSAKIAGVREFLDFLATHPDVPFPSILLTPWVHVDTREQLVDVVRQLGDVAKYPAGDSYEVVRDFGAVRLTVYVPREQICRAVVTGIERVEEKVIPAHDKEIVEWVCDEPLLKPRP